MDWFVHLRHLEEAEQHVLRGAQKVSDQEKCRLNLWSYLVPAPSDFEEGEKNANLGRNAPDLHPPFESDVGWVARRERIRYAHRTRINWRAPDGDAGQLALSSVLSGGRYHRPRAPLRDCAPDGSPPDRGQSASRAA